MAKRAFIFGVNGQDGSYLCELLLGKGYEVVGWIPKDAPVSLAHLEPFRSRIEIVSGTLTSQADIEAFLEQYRPDEIYNLAAPSNPAASWGAPLLAGDIAGLGVVRLLEALRRVAARARFYQASTSEMFGLPLQSPQDEDTPFNPRNPYGMAKLYAHYAVLNYRREYGLYAVSGILFNHESPRRPEHFVTRKISAAAARIKLGLERELRLGNLQARRDWGYAGDYVYAMWLMLQGDAPQDYVIGSGVAHSVGEFCEQAFGCLDLDYRDYVVEDQRYYRPAEPCVLVADPRRARAELGWQPQLDFAALVKLMVQADLQRLKEK